MLEAESGGGTYRLMSGADAGGLHLSKAAPAISPPAAPKPFAFRSRDAKDALPAHTCQQTLTLSFFFDGTGNNLDADIATFEHSNVARLYRSHLEDDDAKGLYRFYLPGIGTLFRDREVDDPGDTLWGKAFGVQGDARLAWAFARLKEKIHQAEQRAQNPTNRICWIKVAAFGFSRGAALARAFCRDLQKLCVESPASGTGWQLRQGQHPIEISFLGLFDTVASAGVPPSANNAVARGRAVKEALAVTPIGKAEMLISRFLQTPELKLLAFGSPGADPSPGFADGHADWANGLQIGGMIQRCVHMVAAHENRNSFGLDSTLVESSPDRFSFPANVTEMIYPGVHSDVGGGYRPGEGGCREQRGAQLSLIPLRAMHAEAIQYVPLVPLPGLQTNERKDFAIDPEGARHFARTSDLFLDYRARVERTTVPGATRGLGGQINAHMRLYYAWRFHRIRSEEAKTGSTDGPSRTARIESNERRFQADRAAIDADLKKARVDHFEAQRVEERLRIALANDRMAHSRYGLPADPALADAHAAAVGGVAERQLALDRVRARRATAADDSTLNLATDTLDRLLLGDARQIVRWMKDDPALKLRPHYAALVEAYRDEYERGRGLSPQADAKLIELFDHFVHDSMAGFGSDESRSSDPRIIYVGGDRRLRYALAPASDARAVSVA